MQNMKFQGFRRPQKFPKALLNHKINVIIHRRYPDDLKEKALSSKHLKWNKRLREFTIEKILDEFQSKL